MGESQSALPDDHRDVVPSPSAKPAHTIYIELASRITTQRLHYRSGDEETAATSIHTLFGLARKLMDDNPSAEEFECYALIMLNDVIRPYTARWHGWMTEDGEMVDSVGKAALKFRDEWVRRKFREELRELQPHLLVFQEIFAALAKGEKPPQTAAALIAKYRTDRDSDVLGAPIPLEIRPQVVLRGANEEGRVDKVDGSDNIAARIANEESTVVHRRRAALDSAATESTAKAGAVMNASGLALSGGGIRSATFCLGIVQVLQAQNLFRRFDYLSTVSGGGYLGAFLSSYLGVDRKYLKAVETKVESDRGKEFTRVAVRTPVPETEEASKTASNAPATANAAAADNPAQRLKRAFEIPPDASESEAIRQLRNNSRYLLNGGTWGLLSILGTFLTGVGSSFLILLTLPISAAWLLRLLKELHWIGNLRCGFDGLLILLALLWLAMPLCRRFAQGAKWDSAASKIASLAANSALAVAVLAVVIGLLAYGDAFVKGSEALRAALWDLKKELPSMLKEIPFGKVCTALLGLVSLVAARLSKRADGTKRPMAAWIFGVTGPIFFLLLFLMFASNLGVGDRQIRCEQCAAIVSGLLLVWTWVFLNVNSFSLHNYYRSRLCECYLAVEGVQQRTWLRRKLDSFLHGVEDAGPTQDICGIGTLQRLPLSALGHNEAAPYHLINATLNAAASKNPTLRGRDGDFFLFSRFYCGSPLTGYITTPDLEKVDPHMDLGTAMAVSGAAASTNMGWQTMRQFRFLMTLFNIRLGYWLRRPGSTPRFRLFEGPGPLYFFRELFGGVQEKTTYINLSDGGHLENLAAYELLRRQCKFIVCVDGGMEPGMECADLMRLQRYAIIDLGIDMQFDLTDFTLLPTHFCRAYAILVKINYGTAEDGSPKLGWMLYLKLALTGTEPRYVLDYRRQNPTFPHQTTAEQIYDEAQFEAYRALGEAAAQSLFREEIIGRDSPADLPGWFQKLAASLLPDNDEVFKKQKPAG